MATGNSGTQMENELNKDAEIKAVEHMLQDWQFILLHADRWMKWKKDSYPAIMAACVTAFFFLIWYLEPTILTTLSLVVMAICLIDYFLPRMFSKIVHTGEWTADHQRHYQRICISIVDAKNKITEFSSNIKEMKTNKPKQYCALILVVLGFVAFIGNAVPNFFLTYLFVLFMVLLPGLNHHGLLKKYYKIAVRQFRDALNQGRKQD